MVEKIFNTNCFCIKTKVVFSKPENGFSPDITSINSVSVTAIIKCQINYW